MKFIISFLSVKESKPFSLADHISWTIILFQRTAVSFKLFIHAFILMSPDILN